MNAGWDWVSRLQAHTESGAPFALVTVIETQGSSPRGVGAKLLVTPSVSEGTIGGGQLEQLALRDARACLARAESKTFRYPLGATAGQCCGGVVTVLVECLNVGPLLYVFGAGHVGQAVARVLAGTAFRVHLIDERADWIEHPALPQTTLRHPVEWRTFVEDHAIWSDTLTHAVIMTHSHDIDQELLTELLPRPCRYLGLIGSESKWLRFKARLEARGMPRERLERVHCPIGQGRWGKAPQEVAISLAAELLARWFEPEPKLLESRELGNSSRIAASEAPAQI